MNDFELTVPDLYFGYFGKVKIFRLMLYFSIWVGQAWDYYLINSFFKNFGTLPDQAKHSSCNQNQNCNHRYKNEYPEIYIYNILLLQYVMLHYLFAITKNIEWNAFYN